MANGDGNGTFRRWVLGIASALLIIWVTWASASINTLNTKTAVTDAQYDHIIKSLNKIEQVVEHLKDSRR
jgi:hypothetical protein